MGFHCRYVLLCAFQHDSQQHHASITAEEARTPQRNAKKMDHSVLQVDPVYCLEQSSVLCRCTVRTSRLSSITEKSNNVLSYQCGRHVRSVQIGVTRCDDKCENTVLLETQVSCRNVRSSAGTVTHDTSVQGKCHKSHDPPEPHSRLTLIWDFTLKP